MLPTTRWFSTLFLLVVVAGCSDGIPADTVCEAREVASGKCTQYHYSCREPYVMRGDAGYNARCYMEPGKPAAPSSAKESK